jgi:hypothetical protein
VVKETPEEYVRQETLRHLLSLIPSHLIAVEVSLKKLSPLQKVPNRRVDIVCFTPCLLSPSLLIECKASCPKTDVFDQLLGYNYFIRAKAIGIAWPENISIRGNQKVLYEGKTSMIPNSLVTTLSS